ncbi:MAG: hypothetical protein F4Y90_07360, partial [Rhodothermaceae bacterium]|nr:hypothetical protein [Rhodothermaceae bacterium]
SVVLQPSAKDFLLEKGYDAKFGARPLKRAIQRYLEDPLAEVILEQGLGNGDRILIDYTTPDETLALEVKRAPTPPPEAEEPKEEKGSLSLEAETASMPLPEAGEPQEEGESE